MFFQGCFEQWSSDESRVQKRGCLRLTESLWRGKERRHKAKLPGHKMPSHKIGESFSHLPHCSPVSSFSPLLSSWSLSPFCACFLLPLFASLGAAECTFLWKMNKMNCRSPANYFLSSQ